MKAAKTILLFRSLLVVEVVTYLEMTGPPALREAPEGMPDVRIVSDMDIHYSGFRRDRIASCSRQ